MYKFFQPLSAATAGLSGIAVYLIDRQKEDLPWLEAGLGMLSIMAYTGLVVYPYSIKQLMETDDVEDKEGTVNLNTQVNKNCSLLSENQPCDA